MVENYVLYFCVDQKDLRDMVIRTLTSFEAEYDRFVKDGGKQLYDNLRVELALFDPNNTKRISIDYPERYIRNRKIYENVWQIFDGKLRGGIFSLAGTVRVFLTGTEVELSKKDLSVCSCSTRDLMIQGCRCGHLQFMKTATAEEKMRSVFPKLDKMLCENINKRLNGKYSDPSHCNRVFGDEAMLKAGRLGVYCWWEEPPDNNPYGASAYIDFESPTEECLIILCSMFSNKYHPQVKP
jgi:hypothetical protein